MSAVTGRRQRPTHGQPKVLLQAWLEPELRDKVRTAADAAGVSMVRYLATLIERDPVDDQGCPVWLPPAGAERQEELTLKTA